MSIKHFDFIITPLTIGHVLQSRLPLKRDATHSMKRYRKSIMPCTLACSIRILVLSMSMSPHTLLANMSAVAFPMHSLIYLRRGTYVAIDGSHQMWVSFRLMVRPNSVQALAIWRPSPVCDISAASSAKSISLNKTCRTFRTQTGQVEQLAISYCMQAYTF